MFLPRPLRISIKNLITSQVNVGNLDVKQVYEILFLGILVVTAGRASHSKFSGVKQRPPFY